MLVLRLVSMLVSMLVSYASVDFFVVSFVLSCAYAYSSCTVYLVTICSLYTLGIIQVP